MTKETGWRRYLRFRDVTPGAGPSRKRWRTSGKPSKGASEEFAQPSTPCQKRNRPSRRPPRPRPARETRPQPAATGSPTPSGLQRPLFLRAVDGNAIAVLIGGEQLRL